MSIVLNEMVYTFEKALLSNVGELTTVRIAIKTKDLAAIVRASYRALKKSALPEKLANAGELKSAEKSNEYRRIGNELYIKKEYAEAIVYYNKALATAPPNSMELKLAYSNISALACSIRHYMACKMNMDAVNALGCPDFLKPKMEKRWEEIRPKIGKQLFRFALNVDDDVVNYRQFNVPRNPEFPCASTDVTVDEFKKVIASKDIRAGTMVAVERAFVSNQDKKTKYTACYYCHRIAFFFIPCEGCTKALFCSPTCKQNCYAEFHRIECHLTSYLYIDTSDVHQELNKLAVKAAIKISLKIGWEKLEEVSVRMGYKRLEHSSVKEAFDSDCPTSILCYDDDSKVEDNLMINKALFCATVIHLIEDVPNYWPEDKEEKQLAIDSLSRIILHLNTTFSRRVEMTYHSVDDVYPTSVVNGGLQRNAGWFSFTSKLAHSCTPNTVALGFNNCVALIALQKIYKGECLSISFVDHYYDMNLAPARKYSCIRQHIIQREINFLCECQVCNLEWDAKTHSPADNLTNRQRFSHDAVATVSSKSFTQQMKTISHALDEFTGAMNMTQHRELYRAFMMNLNVCQAVYDLHIAIKRFSENAKPEDNVEEDQSE